MFVRLSVCACQKFCYYKCQLDLNRETGTIINDSLKFRSNILYLTIFQIFSNSNDLSFVYLIEKLKAKNIHLGDFIITKNNANTFQDLNDLKI